MLANLLFLDAVAPQQPGFVILGEKVSWRSSASVCRVCHAGSLTTSHHLVTIKYIESWQIE